MQCRITILALAVLLASPAAAEVVVVKNAWVRASIAQQKTSGAYLTLTSDEDARLVGASSPAAGAVEIHETRMENNMARMRRAAAIELPAGKPVELKPGGYHFMLLELKRPLKADDTVALTLVIEGKSGKPSSVEVKALVRPLGAVSASEHHR